MTSLVFTSSSPRRSAGRSDRRSDPRLAGDRADRSKHSPSTPIDDARSDSLARFLSWNSGAENRYWRRNSNSQAFRITNRTLRLSEDRDPIARFTRDTPSFPPRPSQLCGAAATTAISSNAAEHSQQRSFGSANDRRTVRDQPRFGCTHSASLAHSRAWMHIVMHADALRSCTTTNDSHQTEPRHLAPHTTRVHTRGLRVRTPIQQQQQQQPPQIGEIAVPARGDLEDRNSDAGRSGGSFWHGERGRCSRREHDRFLYR